MNRISGRSCGKTTLPEQQVYHDIRQPTAEVLALMDPAVAREVFGRHRRAYFGRSSLGGRRVNSWPLPAMSQMGGRASGANCLV